MIRRFVVPWLCTACAALSAQDKSPAPSAAERLAAFYRDVDFKKLDRKVGKEPRYVAEPRYAWFLFGPDRKAMALAVLDKSDHKLDYYDVLYFDRDGDRDVTAAGERFTGKYDESGVPAGLGLEIQVGDHAVPGLDLVHKNFRVSTIPKAGKGIWFSLDFGGETFVCGGFDVLGQNCTVWGRSPADAPVLCPTLHGPLSFAFFSPSGEVELPIGGEEHVNLMAGHRGSGDDTLCPVSEEWLDLLRDTLWVTLIYKDKSGKEARARSQIKEHC